MAKFLDTTSGMVVDYVPVTPNDDTDNVGSHCVGLYVEQAGDVVIINKYNSQERTIGVGDNSYIQIPISRVKEDGTSAAGIHALVTKV